MCVECGAAFANRHGLGTHRVSHGFKHAARQIADGDTCLVCLTRYERIPQLIRHLREQKTNCLETLLSLQTFLDPEEGARLDAIEAAASNAARAKGSLRPPTAIQPVQLHGPFRRCYHQYIAVTDS